MGNVLWLKGIENISLMKEKFVLFWSKYVEVLNWIAVEFTRKELEKVRMLLCCETEM